MPYVKKAIREALEDGVKPMDAGELNYTITQVVKEYLNCQGLSYKVLNEIVGALDCAKLEFYRRIVIPYENTKRLENGDVYR